MASVHPVDDHLRLLDLKVRSDRGEELLLQVPWDRRAFDLEPMLVAGTVHDDDGREVSASPEGADQDVLEVPLGKALRHAQNHDGAASIGLQVDGPKGAIHYTVSCIGLHEPQVHTPYPRAGNALAEERLRAYHLSEEPEWFCDGSSTLACCVSARETPDDVAWVAV